MSAEPSLTTMSKRRLTEARIVAILREADSDLTVSEKFRDLPPISGSEE